MSDANRCHLALGQVSSSALASVSVCVSSIRSPMCICTSRATCFLLLHPSLYRRSRCVHFFFLLWWYRGDVRYTLDAFEDGKIAIRARRNIQRRARAVIYFDRSRAAGKRLTCMMLYTTYGALVNLATAKRRRLFFSRAKGHSAMASALYGGADKVFRNVKSARKIAVSRAVWRTTAARDLRS